MPDLLYKISEKNYRPLLRAIIPFLLFDLYIWFVVQPHLIYYGVGEFTNFPVFFKGWSFFNELAWHPGGLIKYLSAFLSQFLYIDWAGALILTTHAWLMYQCTVYILKTIRFVRYRILGFIPVVLLLMTYNKYTYHFTITTGLLAASAFVCLYLKTSQKGKLPGTFSFLILSVCLYLIAGGAYLFFAAVCVIYEVLFRRRFEIGLFYFLPIAVIPYLLGIMVFGMSITNAYSEFLPFSWEVTSFPERKEMSGAIYALFLLLPVTFVVLGLWRFFIAASSAPISKTTASETSANQSSKRKIKERKKELKKRKKKFRSRQFTFDMQTLSGLKRAINVELLMIIVIAATAIFFSRDFRKKAILKTNYYSCHGDWQRVLLAASDFPDNPLIGHAVNRALYHLGRLPYEMFNYHQHPRNLMLSGSEYLMKPWWRINTYYDLGLVNHCECNLVEAMEMHGEHPEILKPLAILRMVKKDPEAAKVYLRALRRTFMYAEWSENYLRLLDSDPNLTSDEEICRLRNLMPENDIASIKFFIEKMFISCLNKNVNNKMAFEYLMAFYMLNNNLDKLIENIVWLSNFDYPQIPRHYEEAILLFMYFNKKKVELSNYTISENSQKRFNQFVATADKYGTNKNAAFEELAAKFGDTYYFYYIYTLSGLKK